MGDISQKHQIRGMLRLAAQTWVARMVTAILNFGTVIVLSRGLGAPDRGVCAFYAVVIAIALVFSDMAGGATMAWLMKTMSWKQLRIIGFSWSFIASGLVCGIIWLLGKASLNVVLILWLACVLNSGINLHTQILLGFRHLKAYNLLIVFPALGILVFIFPLFHAGFRSTNGYLIALVTSWGLSLLVGMVAVRHFAYEARPPMTYKQIITKAFSSGGVNQAGHIAGMLNNRLVFYLLPATALGVFSNSLSLAEAMLLVPGSIGQVYYSSMAGSAPSEARLAYFKKMQAVNFAILLFGYVVICILPASFYPWLFGPGFLQVKQMLLVLGAGAVFYGLYLLNSYYQSSNGRFVLNLLATCCGLVFNVLGSFLLSRLNKLNENTATYLLAGSFVVICIASFLLMKMNRKVLISNHPDL